MTPDQLAVAKALCDAATPGDWKSDGPRVCDGNCGQPFAYREGRNTYTEYHGGCLTVAVAELGDAVSDARFIAAARTLVPQLIAEVERLTKELNEARAQTGAV